ncbi:MAG TPA: hypothetical protein ENN42_05200 [Thioalkalivibrio sp.]|nr:hypothetical protein [Thioalkalivibrio sp.]
MSDYIDFLAAQAKQDNVPVTPELDAALAALDAEFETLAPQIEVEYVGPGIGMADMQAEHVFKLVVRYHVWDVFKEGWGLKVCDALPNSSLRPMWPVQGVSRLRKKQLVQALPRFFAGYAEAVKAAGKTDTEAGQRALAMASAFAA